jgi:hypothetical protein
LSSILHCGSDAHLSKLRGRIPINLKKNVLRSVKPLFSGTKIMRSASDEEG